MNYLDLQSDIADEFARSDLPVTRFIAYAESELNRVLRLQAMEEIAEFTPTLQTVNGFDYVPFPADFLELEHIETGGIRLEYLTNNQMNVDVGNFYSIADEKILLTGQEPVVLYYFKRIPALSDSNLTNYFTDNAYDVLSYLAFHHAGLYTGDAANYRQVALDLAVQMREMDNRSRISGAPLVQR